MRNDLVGFLLGALEADEAKRVEESLDDPQRGPGLRSDLLRLQRALEPLSADRAPFAAPAGLASRTLRGVAATRGAAERAAAPAGHAAREAAAHRPHPGTPRRHRHSRPASDWSDDRPVPVERSMNWIDNAILAATALAACVLLFPAVGALVSRSRATQTERRLTRVGEALQGYAASHRRYPSPPDGGPMSRGGLYAPLLVSEHRIVADDGTLLVPDSALARSGTFRVPTIQALEDARGTDAFEEMVRSMGGDFGYTLGHRDAAGRLQPIVGLNRAHHPLMADAPDASGERSDNHADGLHHVLWEDGRVDRLHESRIHVEDHLFLNHDGQPAAGKDPEDAVIGDSHHQP
ncbi:MAG: hypothetical protein ACKO3G_15255 [Planctomycetaceae bacterium]